MRKSKKILALMAVLAMLLTLIPFGTAAFASGTYEALNVLTVPDGGRSDLGDVLARVTAGSLGSGIVNVRLPADYTFNWAGTPLASTTSYETYGDNTLAGDFITIPARYSDDNNGLYGTRFKVTKIAENEFQISKSLAGPNLNENDGYIYFHFKQVYIPSGESGALNVTFEPPSSSGFPKGQVQVATISGGDVLITVDEVKTFTDTSPTIILRFKETTVNSWEPGQRTMKLRLPSGFEWASVGDGTSYALTDSDILWGKAWSKDWINNNITFEKDDRDLYINVSGVAAASATYPDGSGGTVKEDGKVPTPAIYFKLPVTIQVSDETTARYGDVEITISGKTDRNVNSLIIAKYGEQEATAKAENPPTIVTGQTEQQIADIVIEESAPGSLVEGRTITLTLPANAKWGLLPNVSTENNLDLEEVGFVGDDGRTFKWRVFKESTTDPGKVTFEQAEIMVAGDTTGDIDVEVGGTAQVNGKVVVAKAVGPVTAKASSKASVVTGVNAQPAGDIVITEGAKEALSKDKNLELTLPLGVTFTDTPKVKVTEGDLDLDEGNIRLTNDDRTLTIPIDNESTKPSTITVSDIKYDIDRSVAQGNIEVKIGGAAVNEVNDLAELDSYLGKVDEYEYYEVGGFEAFVKKPGGAFPSADTVARVVNAVCVTSATGTGTGGKAVFTIGQTSYEVNGKKETMDVAPYIKDGRTYLPIRYVGLALGVDPSNIIWDGTKATLIKGDKVVQVTPGSNVMVINAASITMDVAPEIVDGRTMLPFRWIAQAFGAKVNWDETTQAVTMEL